MNNPAFQNSVNRLRSLYADVRAGRAYAPFDPFIDAGPEVYARFQPIFASAHISRITAEEFLPFLIFKNNKHWTGLNRQGSRMTANMAALQRGLTSLLDESKPIIARYDDALPRVRGMGPATATAILHVAYPDKYGIWNGTSEQGLRLLGMWPSNTHGVTEGERYAKINKVLLALTDALDLDLWRLDVLWHYLRHEESTER